ncbi:PTS mannose/fructose/sorbose transporter subunit IIAB [Allofustis seminis]|uniref:PTS mannose/fructose/sorbose transporter subunit IIAB n=1 Tax=Allofustis seminis TaxID=166939 RepID=UPI0003785FD0|nr:PTS mannose/fructose/sorbose transporter subunit IIAB [Allofustis seminis]
MTKMLFLTHGNLASGVQDTVEMIIGPQDAIQTFSLHPTCDIQVFEDEVFSYIQSVDEELLIFVDIIGGSPYNIAQKALNEFGRHYLISGLNVPMILEIAMLLEQQPAAELARLAICSGKEAVQLFNKDGLISNEEALESNTAELLEEDFTEAHHSDQALGMGGEIVFARVDFRLLHGQVATRWVPKIRPDTILIVDDALYEDQEMIEVYRSAAPHGIQVFVVPSQVVAYAYQHHTLPAGKVMLLFRNIEQLDRTLEMGLHLDEIQLGGIPKTATNKMVLTAVSLSNQDVEVLDKVEAAGTKVYIQILPDEAALTYDDAKLKMN